MAAHGFYVFDFCAFGSHQLMPHPEETFADDVKLTFRQQVVNVGHAAGN